MFGSDKYVVIGSNILICAVLFVGLALLDMEFRKKQTAELSHLFDRTMESQTVVLDILRAVREDQRSMAVVVSTLRDTATSSRTLGQGELAEITAKVTELNNSINTMSNRVKNLPKSSCYILHN